MTGYLFSLNGGASVVAQFSTGRCHSQQCEAELVAALQAGQDAVYLRALLRGFYFRQVGATE